MNNEKKLLMCHGCSELKLLNFSSVAYKGVSYKKKSCILKNIFTITIDKYHENRSNFLGELFCKNIYDFPGDTYPKQIFCEISLLDAFVS